MLHHPMEHFHGDDGFPRRPRRSCRDILGDVARARSCRGRGAGGRGPVRVHDEQHDLRRFRLGHPVLGLFPGARRPWPHSRVGDGTRGPLAPSRSAGRRADLRLLPDVVACRPAAGDDPGAALRGRSTAPGAAAADLQRIHASCGGPRLRSVPGRSPSRPASAVCARLLPRRVPAGEIDVRRATGAGIERLEQDGAVDRFACCGTPGFRRSA